MQNIYRCFASRELVPNLLNSNSVAMMLTLRYDPTRATVRRALSKDDFHPKYGDWDVESGITTLAKEELSKISGLNKLRSLTLSLSGGVDSRLSLAMIRQFLPTVKVSCIRVGFGDADDEVSKAKEIARFHDCDFHEVIIDNVLEELPKLIGIVGEPRWNLYHYYTFEYGKKISDIFFTGDGGDELLGGYTFRYHKFLSQCSSGSDWEERARIYLSCHERDWVPDQDKMFGEAVSFSWDKIYTHFKPYFQNNLDPLDQVFLADFNGKLLFDWLPTNHAFEKHLGINIHSLFLNDAMIKFAFGVPWNKKYDVLAQIGKLPLRSLLNKLEGVTFENDLNKKGFSVGLAGLWERNAREIVKKYLNNDSEIIKTGLISANWLTRTITNLSEMKKELNLRYTNKLLSVLALEIWHRLFVSHSLDQSEKL